MRHQPMQFVEGIHATHHNPHRSFSRPVAQIILAAAALALSASTSLAQDGPGSTSAMPADAYKTNDGTVVVLGLAPTQRYQIRMLTAQNKSSSRQDKTANRCGEVVVEKAADYITLVVGAHSIDPAALSVKEHIKCRPLPSTNRMTPTGVVHATPPSPQ